MSDSLIDIISIYQDLVVTPTKKTKKRKKTIGRVLKGSKKKLIETVSPSGIPIFDVVNDDKDNASKQTGRRDALNHRQRIM